MRSWIFGNKGGNKEDEKETSGNSSAIESTGIGSTRINQTLSSDGAEPQTSRGFFRGIGKQDAEIDRRVSLSARNLCNGVQRIVMAAKGKSGMEWKSELLTLLGGSDEEPEKIPGDNNSGGDVGGDSSATTHCDMDVLLAAPKTEKYLMRCLENELPPNMIHCLRLLRVLELQHAAETYKEYEAQGKVDQPIKPISSRATAKVSQLLCNLCTNPSVGEQLRLHLFGLLALSGASYPSSGVHVARAASQVIIAFAQNCLSNSLVLFLHDRKMIIHMTDDIKELCATKGDSENASVGEHSVSSSSNNNFLSLYGSDAEEAGLWAISLSTVVNLVYYSCRHDCKELLNDFDSANGYQVLKGAILQSKSMHGKKLMELLPLLGTCQRSTAIEDKKNNEIAGNPEDSKEGQNTSIFTIFEEIAYESVPLLKLYVEENDGLKPEITNDEKCLGDLTNYSLEVAKKCRFQSLESPLEIEAETPKSFDIVTDLLLSALQLYSDHVKNYDLLEEECHFLTLYIIAFPTFEEENLKILILKTIEFVVTGVTGSKALQPFSVLSEVFVGICRSLLEESLKSNANEKLKGKILKGLFTDTDLINESLEKIFRFDGKVGPQIMQSGRITSMVDRIADMLTSELNTHKDSWQTTFEDKEGNLFIEPPITTPFDTVCAAILRVFALVMGFQAKRGASLLTVCNDKEQERGISYLLMASIKELGDESVIAALSVFQAIIASRENLHLLVLDMEYCLKTIDYFTNMTSKSCGIPEAAKKILSKKKLDKSTVDEIKFAPTRKLNAVVLQRISWICTTLKHALESSSLAREAFRLTDGFNTILNVVLSLGGCADHCKDSKETSTLLDLFRHLLSLVDTSIGFTGRKEVKDMEFGALIPITLPPYTLVDPVSSQHGPCSSSTSNLYHLRLKSFYLDFAIAISQTRIMKASGNAVQILELAMSHMDPSFNLTKVDVEKSNKVQMMRNPDAARLVLGLVLFLPENKEGDKLAKRAFDQIIRLCDPSRVGTTLPQIAKCGMVWSITNPKEFGPILDDTSHRLYPRFTLLLRRIAAFSMSHSDFVSVFRGIAGPLLRDERTDSKIRLPVISSSIRQRITKKNDVIDPESFEEKETDFCRRLESLCAIAERGQRVPFCTMGGDTINTLSILLHKTKVEDRLYKASEAGRLNFLEVDCLDLSSLKPGGFLSAGVAAPGSSGGERIWTPMSTTGFSFSMWFKYSRPIDDTREGNIYLFDVSNPTVSTSDGTHTPQSAVFLSVWYDALAQQFNVVSSSSTKGEPLCFPVSPLVPGVWHHVLLTYTPTKRTMMGRKSLVAMYVDGRPLEAEMKIESINIAPNARVLIGAPNAVIAASGMIRGMILNWELGPTLLLSTVLMELDATAIFIYGPDFEGLFWGDRPQRLSLSATGTSAFALLSETGEPGSVASALRRRDIARLEAAGTISREMGVNRSGDDDNDSLGSLGLLCTIPPDCVVFAYRASTTNQNSIRESRESSSLRKRNTIGKLVNLARINNGNDCISTDASLFGKAGAVNPRCFEDNIQWAGGPEVLMPLVYAAPSARSLALTLRLFRASTNRHPPNLEAMQGGGGFQVLAILIQGKKFVDIKIIEQAFAFAVHGFVPPSADSSPSSPAILQIPIATNWVFSDLDAMKQLLLNHQVWDLKNTHPDLPLRLITLVNGLVGQKSMHKAFNSRRLHLVGIIRWTLHLMVEAAELYSAGEIASQTLKKTTSSSDDELDLDDTPKTLSNPWHIEAPCIDAICVGADPDNPLLQASKTLLRRVLTFMLTPGDLEAIAEATMYTVSIGAFSAKTNTVDQQKAHDSGSEPERLLPGSVTRIYLLRLIEELIVDGVNEIIASGEKKIEGETGKDPIPPAAHAGGVANVNQAYFSTALLGGKIMDGEIHPKHQQAQNFLAAFGSIFTPVWFAALLEGCNDEATASAVLRLLILMIQSSPSFAAAFDANGGFAPLVISIPKFSTCSTIIIALLSELLHVSILHLPSFPILDASQLNEIFEQESEVSEKVSNKFAESATESLDPSCGVFALLAECIGRNVQLSTSDNDLGKKARQTNIAILELLKHRHNLSSAFQSFCTTQSFLRPLIHTMCLVHDEKFQRMQSESKSVQSATDAEAQKESRRGSLKDVPSDVSPVERFVGGDCELGSDAGVAMVHLLRIIIANAVVAGPVAPPLVYSLFSSYPEHTMVDQVGAYHLLLLDLIKTTIEDAVDLGEATALSACTGLCSVLLDKMMRGFFTSELILHTVAMTLFLLDGLTSSSSMALTNVGTAERAIITADAAHIARMACLCGIRRSRPMNAEDIGDSDLQDTLVQMTAKNIDELMIVPKNTGLRRNAGVHSAPSTNSSKYPLWAACNISRCSQENVVLTYPELCGMEEPLQPFIIGLMAEVAYLLKDERDEIRLATITIVVILLQHGRGMLSSHLIKEVQIADNQVETIDVMNRGGFGALLVAHEVAQASGAASANKNYKPFFVWYEKHKAKVQIIFDGIEKESVRIFPGLTMGTHTADEAVEIEQMAIAMKTTSNDAADRTIIGGLERAELAQRYIDKTAEGHVHWKRQGFDDLASGAMHWKFLLRRLKGSYSIWEGDTRSASVQIYNRHHQLYTTLMEKKSGKSVVNKDDDEEGRELVRRWKLDLSEGYERQRRRLLPNYEFHGLYNIDESLDDLEDTDPNAGSGIDAEKTRRRYSSNSPDNQGDFFATGSGVEATTELLKELNIKKIHRGDDFDEDYDDGEEDTQTLVTEATGGSAEEGANEANVDEVNGDNAKDEEGEDDTDNLDVKATQEDHNETENVASSYELITGLLHAGEWPEQSYNVRRCTGLEVRKALLLWCRDSIYIIDGFEQSGEGLEGRIVRVEKEESSFNINLRPKDFKASDDVSVSDTESIVESNDGDKSSERMKSSKTSGQESSNNNEVAYQHRSQRISFSELHSVFRRRYQLQQIALEFYDIHNSGTLVAFANNDEREEVLSKILAAPLPNSIFSSFMGTSINYRKFMNSWKSKIVSQWVNGRMTNFEFLMYLNSFAGRTYNDLTQYPVFPWVIADYESDEIDLNDPKTYRDLSKPMGALGEDRARQFRDRFEALQQTYISEDDPPPFHYGTHYSCAAYVLYYLMRLEPFSRLALALQGGRFDVADRLFHNIGSSWKSASEENLQDVRELIPEFFYLPDFLTNTNHFDFGATQKGKHVHNVTLPKWAKGDPETFVRINRQALESEHVSKHLHLWIDLIFGCKQRGEQAVKSLNTFVHVTYEGEVDLESMTDVVQRESTIAQIQNFGQTPSRLERRSFPQRIIYSALKENEKNIDYNALSYLAPLTPPFCVVGASHRCTVKRFSSEQCKLGVSSQSDKAVGDMCLIKGQLVGVGRMCSLNIAAKTFYRFGGPNNGICVHNASTVNRNREANKLLTVHDGLHSGEVSVAKASLNGQWLVTGSIDSTVRLWKYENPTLKLQASLIGHGGWKITCVDISTVFGTIVTGCAQGRVILWDLRTLTFVRRLRHVFKDESGSGDGGQRSHTMSSTSVSINQKNGNIVTLVGPYLSVFDINGNLRGTVNSLGAKPSCAIATDCPEWQDEGIVVVTGHINGEVRFWKLNPITRELVVHYLMVDREHVTEITSLRATGNERQDTLLVGDKSGKMSICRTIQIDNISSNELAEVIADLKERRRLATSSQA
ncbi:unnamed protein product [Pseudo-nitzschia multistriata]|uniref:BEACH domain-containing protein n=1 Tax=Pseudo-nitzschia multistriata TaxID=183589 RepID=A0A448Z2Q0_9STRA|nr:unnamed protein product [Pseudo-nitzschia multistriata]